MNERRFEVFPEKKWREIVDPDENGEVIT